MSQTCKLCGGRSKPDAKKCAFCGAPLAAEPPRAPQNSGSMTARTPTYTVPTPPPRSTPTPTPAAPARPAPTPTPAAPARPAPTPTPAAPARPAPAPAPSTPVASAPPHSDKNEGVFDTPDWRRAWTRQQDRDAEQGIILTNTRNLKDRTAFNAALKDYVDSRAAAGVEYTLLDLNTQKVGSVFASDCGAVVDLLDTIYDVAMPSYLLILGDDSVVPSQLWYNMGTDDDPDVMSDLPYITLDTDSPWSGKRFDFSGSVQVGRIPTRAQNGFREAISYFKHAATFKPYHSSCAFACSAKVWAETSAVEFAPVRADMITSPEYTTNRKTAADYGLQLLTGVDAKYNLLCFNLHGSNTSHYWYGQLAKFYPIGFEKAVLPPVGHKGYALLTEACYGARPKVGDESSEKSMVVHALTTSCVAFVGSSRVAFGSFGGHMSCADIVGYYYTAAVAKGKTFGEAFLDAMTNLCNKSQMNEDEIKTLAEFALYGDPSGVLVSSVNKGVKGMRRLSKAKPVQDSSMAITLMSCDGGDDGRVRGVTLMDYTSNEQAQIKLMANTVRQTGKEYVLSQYAEMAEVEPKVYKVVGREGYRAVYSKKEGEFSTVVKLYMDDRGQVEMAYTSK